ncbi:serine hydrolase domain-containing protein [Streptomyces mangrovisoli]|uniref:Peptidase S12 family protein n=1 Tax=Streptomyces mangrovisoli TaxID=1428628 RepID=A0A1J4NNG9_9ACTN|nr:serine hydrolase domain-containing protein [Streptomyces mangrovisoli]OIJ63690.1 peptidase S12 family protein [Streptomyces mangrovisoli]
MTPFTTDDLARFTDTLNGVITDGATPGGVIVCGTLDEEPHVLTAGVISEETGPLPPNGRTLYDIASLTKVVATWPLIGSALSDGLLELDAPVREALPPFAGEAPSGEATVRQLLSHTSGLRASTRLDHYRGADAPLHELLCREPVDRAPGTHQYINRGYILLGLVLTHLRGRPLDVLTHDLWRAAGMDDTLYGPVGRGPRVAPTEQRIPGTPRIWGAAHDDNAALLGGIAGHAGAFSTAADLAAYARRLLRGHRDGDPLGQWLRTSLVPQVPMEPGLGRGLGWIVAADGAVAYHHGWTGTSLYVAPANGRYIAVATNAVYCGAARTRIAPLRELALKTLCTS